MGLRKLVDRFGLFSGAILGSSLGKYSDVLISSSDAF